MNYEQAINYLKSSGMSEEQIKTVVNAIRSEQIDTIFDTIMNKLIDELSDVLKYMVELKEKTQNV